MNIHIDFGPTKDCKHPEWTYGMICVKCNECGRFNDEPEEQALKEGE